MGSSRRGQWSAAAATLALSLGLGAGAGCGGGAPGVSSSTSEATVKGTVKIDGKPMTSGEITFNPANVARRDAPAHTAPVGKDGSYTVRTLAGDNRVTVTGPEVRKHPSLEYEEKLYDAPAGESTFDVDLVSPKAPQSPGGVRRK